MCRTRVKHVSHVRPICCCKHFDVLYISYYPVSTRYVYCNSYRHHVAGKTTAVIFGREEKECYWKGNHFDDTNTVRGDVTRSGVYMSQCLAGLSYFQTL